MSNYLVENVKLESFYKELTGILSLTPDEFQNIEGVTEQQQYMFLKLKSSFLEQLKKTLFLKPVNIEDQIFQHYCLFRLMRLKEEVVLVFFLDGDKKLIADEILSIGYKDNVPIENYMLFKRIFHHSAKNIIFVHNHPSGLIHPSQGDLRFTSLLSELCDQLGLTCLDSLIVGKNGIYSIKGRK